jgi:hypothetical protein
MQLSNVHVLGEGVLLEPTLAEFVNKLALAKPEWTFTYDSAKAKYHTTSKCMQSNQLAPNGAEYAVRMDVTQNSRHLGAVSIQRNVSRDHTKKWCLTVSSDSVAHSRQRGGTTKTTNMVTAIRNAKTYLKCPSLGRVVYEHATDTWDNYEHALNRLEVSIHRGHFLPSLEGAQILLNSFVRNQTPDPILLSQFGVAMHNPKFEEALSQYMLAQHMRTLPQGAIPIYLMEGLYAFFTDGELLRGPKEVAEKTEPQLVPFEALPLEWQNNLAVLQLMENNEVVKDVGYRRDADNFVIVR